MRDPDETRPEPPASVNPALRRSVSRRGLLTDELSRAGKRLARQLPSLAPVLKAALRESQARREERLVRNLWQLLAGREPKPQELTTALEVVRAAHAPEEKADALVDLLWALCQTREFEAVNRPNAVLVRGLYHLALRREPSEEEKAAALAVLDEAPELPARVAALEGLFTGLLRSADSVLRRDLDAP